MEYKLKETVSKDAFRYGYLVNKIAPFLKPHLPRIILNLILAVPLGLLDGVVAFALKPYMDYVVGNKALELSFHGINISISSLQMAWILPIGIILFAAAQGVLRYLNRYLSAWVSRKITIDVRFALYNKLINMHPQFFDDNSSGIINSRYIGDPKTASASIVDNLRIITTDICGAVGLIAVMMYSSWKLAFVGVLVLCVAFVPVALIRKRIRETSNKNMVIGGKITTNMNETHSGSKIMTAYGLQDRQEKLFREQILESFKISMALTKRTAWMSPLMYQIASIGVAIVLGYGTYLINIGQMTVQKAFEDEDAIGWGSPAPFNQTNAVVSDKQLNVGSTQYVLVKVDMPETVGNEANHNGVDVPSIEFGINVLASQYIYEEDSYGSDYDADAVYYDTLVTTDEEFLEALNDTDVKYIAIDGDVTYDWGGDSYANSKALLMKGKTIFGLNLKYRYFKNSLICFSHPK